MTGLALLLARAGGWPRMLLLAACTALVSGLLLVVVAILRLPEHPREPLFDLVADPGLRGGTAFSTALLTVPALLLLYQVVRLGTAVRERRLAGLRVAGATPAEVRWLGAVEVGVPAGVGAISGLGVYAALRGLLGGGVHGRHWVTGAPAALDLVPTTVGPTWWQALAVVVGVTVLGVAVGLRASRHVVVSPLGVTRRQPPPPPRPWGPLLLLAVGAVAAALPLLGDVSDLVALVLVGLAVVALVGLAPWAAYRIGHLVQARSGSPAMLLAARRLIGEPRPVGRAAAAVGGIALVAGGAAQIAASLVTEGQVEAFYVVSLLLVAAALLGALLVVLATLAVHSVESLLDRKRSLAALLAGGTPPTVLERAQRHEIALVAMPVALLGVVLGACALTAVSHEGAVALLLVTPLAALLVLGLVWLATRLAVRATRPWLLRAGAPGNLRTE